MSDEPDDTSAAEDDAPLPGENEPPDESTMMGMPGVQTEVLAEVARAEAEMADPTRVDDSDDSEGAEV